LKKAGHSFAITRGFQSTGHVDPTAKDNIDRAHAAGIDTVDVYLFPCVSCGDPAGQVKELVAGMAGANYGMIWIDIEIYRWSTDLASNRDFITAMINEGKAEGKKIGIYTSYNNWENIVGISWNGAADLPLWYAHYDNSPSFGDFRAFGGWSKPTMKQYAGDATACGASVDLNYEA